MGRKIRFVSPQVDGINVRSALSLTVRFTPDMLVKELRQRGLFEEAEDFIRGLFLPILTPEDQLILVDSAPPAKPGLSNSMLASMIGKHDLQVQAKLGWTDVAFFDQRGIPAANFGPGDATLAHMQDERVTKPAVDSCYLVLKSLIENGL